MYSIFKLLNVQGGFSTTENILKQYLFCSIRLFFYMAKVIELELFSQEKIMKKKL